MTVLRLSREEVRAAVVEEAQRWLGTPYRHQGSRRGVGCDCLGLVLGIWRSVLGEPPGIPGAYTMDWAESAHQDPLLDAAFRHCDPIDRDQAKPGDMILFRWQPDAAAKHLAILMPDNRMIHAHERIAVTQVSLVPSWRRRLAGVFAFPLIQKR